MILEEEVPIGEEEEDELLILEDIPPTEEFQSLPVPFPHRWAQPSKGKNNIEIGRNLQEGKYKYPSSRCY